MHRELSKRYGGDYQIVACGRPGELRAWMRDLRAAGLQVALVIGGVGVQDPDGVEVLAGVRAIDPTALRVAAVGWGDWHSVGPVFGAVTLGAVDHWVFRPVQAPDEEFQRMITEFLREWSSQRPGGFEPVQVIRVHAPATEPVRKRRPLPAAPVGWQRPDSAHRDHRDRAAYRRLGIPALEDLQGRGVFYGTAASEAPAMAGWNVFIAGGGNSAGQAALHLAKWAKKVTILVRGQSLADSMSDYLIRQIGAAPHIDIRYHVQVAGGTGTGTGHLQSLVLEDTTSGEQRTVAADALFILIGAQPRTEWLGPALDRDRWGFIRTGPDLPTSAHWPAGRPPLPLETSLPGVFAAGDVRRGSVKRVASAVGEGAATIPLRHARPGPHHRRAHTPGK